MKWVWTLGDLLSPLYACLFTHWFTVYYANRIFFGLHIVVQRTEHTWEMHNKAKCQAVLSLRSKLKWTQVGQLLSALVRVCVTLIVLVFHVLCSFVCQDCCLERGKGEHKTESDIQSVVGMYPTETITLFVTRPDAQLTNRRGHIWFALEWTTKSQIRRGVKPPPIDK